jgi:hypothetical protein
MAYKKVTDCANLIKLRNIGKHLFKTGCKWESKVKRAETTGPDTGEQEHKIENALRGSTNRSGKAVVLLVAVTIVGKLF